jgi:hypothetical protein
MNCEGDKLFITNHHKAIKKKKKKGLIFFFILKIRICIQNLTSYLIDSKF